MKTGFGQGLAVGEKKEDRVAVLIAARIHCFLLLTSMALSSAGPNPNPPPAFTALAPTNYFWTLHYPEFSLDHHTP
jgi:hypothetical protein